jgi:hypothetical protein
VEPISAMVNGRNFLGAFAPRIDASAVSDLFVRTFESSETFPMPPPGAKTVELTRSAFLPVIAVKAASGGERMLGMKEAVGAQVV